MAQGIYNRCKYNLAVGALDLSSDTINVLLLNNTHTFNADDDVLTDINTNEITGTGYTTGGVALAGKVVTQDDTNDWMKFDANDSSWTTATFTAYHAALNDITASNNLIGSIDFGGAKSVTAGTFLIQWAANGIVRLL